MEVIIIAAVIIVALGYFIWSSSSTATVVKTLDVNGDGKVNLKDAVQLGEVAVQKTKATAAKVKTAAKKAVAPKKAAAPKKPTAPKKTVKKPAVKKAATKKAKK